MRVECEVFRVWDLGFGVYGLDLELIPPGTQSSESWPRPADSGSVDYGFGFRVWMDSWVGGFGCKWTVAGTRPPGTRSPAPWSRPGGSLADPRSVFGPRF